MRQIKAKESETSCVSVLRAIGLLMIYSDLAAVHVTSSKTYHIFC
jgi:hypothetical protein